MTEAETLEGSDLVLLLLAAPTSVESAANRVNGITRLEKLLYLADRETTTTQAVTGEKLGFIAYDFGPFSKDVYQAVEILEQSGLLTEHEYVDGHTVDGIEDVLVTGEDQTEEYVERRFELTANGKLVAELLSRHHPEVVRQLSAIKDRYAERPLSSLIRYVYKTYPKSAVNSKIAHRF